MRNRNRTALASLIVLGTPVLMTTALIFQPWKLFIDTEVQEEIPAIQQTAKSTIEPTESQRSPSESPSKESSEQESSDSNPTVLFQGALISHEHQTSGTVKILQLADGSRILRLEDLSTSDGPRVEVWLTDAPVIEGLDGWFVFDDGKYESLGAIKGNKGNQNYKIPADVDLSEFTSVSLWCVTFAVSFGAAELGSNQKK